MQQSTLHHPPPIHFTWGEKIKFFLLDTKFHKFLWVMVIVAYGFLLAWTVEGNKEDDNKTTQEGENTYEGYRWTVMLAILGSAIITLLFEFFGFNVRFDHPFASINLVFQTILGYLVWACGAISLLYLVLQELQVELWETFKDMSYTRRAQFALILIAMFILGIGQIVRMYKQHFDAVRIARGEEWRDDDENVAERMWWGFMSAFGRKREWRIERERKKRERMYKQRTGPIHNTIQPYNDSIYGSGTTVNMTEVTTPTHTAEFYNTPSASQL